MAFSILAFAEKEDPYGCTDFSPPDEEAEDILVTMKDPLDSLTDKVKKLANIVLCGKSIAAALGEFSGTAEEIASSSFTEQQRRLYNLWKAGIPMPSEMKWVAFFKGPANDDGNAATSHTDDSRASKRQRTFEGESHVNDRQTDSSLTERLALSELFHLPLSQKHQVVGEDVAFFRSSFRTLNPLLDAVHEIVRLRGDPNGANKSHRPECIAKELDATRYVLDAIEKQLRFIRSQAQKGFALVDQYLDIIRERERSSTAPEIVKGDRSHRSSLMNERSTWQAHGMTPFDQDGRSDTGEGCSPNESEAERVSAGDMIELPSSSYDDSQVQEQYRAEQYASQLLHAGRRAGNTSSSANAGENGDDVHKALRRSNDMLSAVEEGSKIPNSKTASHALPERPSGSQMTAPKTSQKEPLWTRESVSYWSSFNADSAASPPITSHGTGDLPLPTAHSLTPYSASAPNSMPPTNAREMGPPLQKQADTADASTTKESEPLRDDNHVRTPQEGYSDSQGCFQTAREVRRRPHLAGQWSNAGKEPSGAQDSAGDKAQAKTAFDPTIFRSAQAP